MKLIVVALFSVLSLKAFAAGQQQTPPPQDSHAQPAHCVNLAGVYAASSDPLNQQVFEQEDCSIVRIHIRVVDDPSLGTVDLAKVNWYVGDYPHTEYPFYSENFRFEGDVFIHDWRQPSDDGRGECLDRHVYSLSRHGNLQVREHYECNGHDMHLGGTQTMDRVDGPGEVPAPK